MTLAQRARRIPLLALLLTLACSQAPRVEPLASRAETRTERATDLRDARALLLLMADQKRYEDTVFVALLDSSASVRQELAVTLGRIGDRRGRGMLQGLLIDTEPAVRQSAAFALGELGDPDARAALVRASVDDDSQAGALAVEAQGKLQTPLADVRRALTALDPDEAARRLAPALFRFKEDSMVEVAAEFASAAYAGAPAVRLGAAYALGRDARPGALPHLRALTSDAEPRIRASAARGLGDVGDLSDLALLEPLLADSASSPRIQALRAGARILARTQAVAPLGWGRLLAGLVEDPQPGIRAMALESASAWVAQPEVQLAVQRRLSAGEPRERELALLALAQAQVPEASDAILRAAGSSERTMRARAAEAAGILGLADVVERLAADPEPSVRVAAIESLLAAVPEEGSDWQRTVGSIAGRFLGDPDPTVRATVLEGLVEAPVLATERLRQALLASERDLLKDARLAAVRALAARAQAMPGEYEAAVSILQQLNPDRDYLVRREAGAALEQLGLPRPEIGAVATGRTGPVYSQILAQTDRVRYVEVTTARGSFRIRLDCPQAPLTCLSFLQLAGQGYFDGLMFHRVVPDFVVQAGDPRGDGWGGPGFALRDEINRLRFVRGAVGMALSGPDTGGSQFFIALSPQPHLDGGYTVFGQVEGDDSVLDRIRQQDGLLTIREVETDE